MIELGLYVRTGPPRPGQTDTRLSTSVRLLRTGNLLLLPLDGLEPCALQSLAHAVAAGDHQAAVALADLIRSAAVNLDTQLRAAGLADAELASLLVWLQGGASGICRTAGASSGLQSRRARVCRGVETGSAPTTGRRSMTTRKSNGAKPAPVETASQAREAVRDVAAMIAELEELAVAGLQARYFETFGEAARSRNRTHLIKKIAWRLQEQAEGGLSAEALAKIDELANSTPTRQRPPRKAKKAALPPAETTAETPEAPAPAEKARDPRLPPVGGELVKTFRGEEHRVLCLDDGFEWNGTTYKSLSKLAKAITGSVWNGYGFFGLLARGEKGGEA